MAKVKTQAQLKKNLDKIFSEYVRRSSADEYGNVRCYTCSQKKHWKEMHAGHYVSRQYLATRWDTRNVKSQCAGCNLFGNGRPLDFEERLKSEYGNDLVEKMKASRHQMMKVDRQWYQQEINRYTELLKDNTNGNISL
jgi:hypothetical protein